MTALSGELIPAGTPMPAARGGEPEPDPGVELIRHWLIGYPSAHTRGAFRVDIAEWTRFCRASDLSILHTRRIHVEAWVRSLEHDPRQLAPATIARRINAVSSFYTWAVCQEEAPRNPCTGVKRPATQPDPVRLTGLTLGQLAALLNATGKDSHRYAARDAFAFHLMALNGLRAGSIAAANIGDLVAAGDVPGLSIPVKGGRRMFTPFAKSTIAARDIWLDQLGRAPWIRAGVIVHRNQLSGRTRSPLFTQYDRPDRARRDSFTAPLRRVARIAALPPAVAERITPHWLRHTFVTLSLAAGVDLQHVQDGAGHASPRTTRDYDGNRNSIPNHATFTLDRVLADHMTGARR